jgi:hypothetical protein
VGEGKGGGGGEVSASRFLFDREERNKVLGMVNLDTESGAVLEESDSYEKSELRG